MEVRDGKVLPNKKFYEVKYEKQFYGVFQSAGSELIESESEQGALEVFNNTTRKKLVKENETINPVEVSNIGYFEVDNPEEARQMFGNSDDAFGQYRMFKATYAYNKKKREGK